MPYDFRAAMSAAAFVASIAAGPALAQLVPDPADLATIGIGSIQTGRPGDGQTLVGVNVGDTRHQEGSGATATLLAPDAVADVNFANVTTPQRTQLADVAGVTAGPTAVTNPRDGGSAVSVAVASANQAPGSTATLGIASGNSPASLGVAGRSVVLPGWSGMPGLPGLPFTLPKTGAR